MNKNTIALLLALTVLTTACKKKDSPSNSTTTTGGATTGNTTGNTTGGTTGNTTSTGTFTNASKFSGFFFTQDITQNFSGNPMPRILSAGVSFLNDPASGPSLGTPIQIGSVQFNGLDLAYGGGYYSTSYTQTINFNAEDWTVNGNSTIPTFTIAVGGNRPAGMNTGVIPTTISKAAGLTINFGTLVNVKGGWFTLADASTGILSTPLQAGATSINFTPVQLSALAKGNGTIGFNVQNYQGIHILGKNFQFIQDVQLYQQVTITD